MILKYVHYNYYKCFLLDNNSLFIGFINFMLKCLKIKSLTHYCVVTGYQVSNATFCILVHRYGNKDGLINFNDFVAAIAKLTSMFGKKL